MASTPLDHRREVSQPREQEATPQSSEVAPDVATPAPAVRACRRCGLATKNHPGRCGVQHCTVPLPEGLRDTSAQNLSLALSPPAREGREEDDSDVMDTSLVCVHSHRKDEMCNFPCTGCKGRMYYWCTFCKVSRGYQLP